MADYAIPKSGAAFILYTGLIDQSSTKLLKANPTIASGDFKVSIDGGAFANLTTLPTVTPASGTAVKISLSAAETTGDNIVVACIDAAGAEWCDQLINIQTAPRGIADLAYPATSGRSMVVDASGLVDANTVKVGPTGSGTAQTARDIGASVLLSSGTGTGQLNFTSGVVQADAAKIGGTSQTALDLGGNWTAARATKVDNLDAAVSTRLASSGYTAPLDAAGTRTAVGLASANLDTQLAAIAGYIDTEVGAIYLRIGAPAGVSISADIAAVAAKTGNLPAAPAATGDIPTAAAVGAATLAAAAAAPIAADVKKVAGTTIDGAGTAGDPWGPA